jgi:hypothetical protein
MRLRLHWQLVPPEGSGRLWNSLEPCGPKKIWKKKLNYAARFAWETAHNGVCVKVGTELIFPKAGKTHCSFFENEVLKSLNRTNDMPPERGVRYRGRMSEAEKIQL